MKKKIHALIVGGTRGLGRVIAKTLGANGMAVSVLSRHGVLPSDKTGIFNVAADLKNRRELEWALAEALKKNGPLDSLIFSQRFRGEGDAWDDEIATALSGTKDVIELAKDKFNPKGSKSILVIGSVAGQYVVDDQPVAYHVSKAALDQLVRYYAVALGPRGIRVNGIAPCAFIKAESRKFYLGNKNRRSFFQKLTPLGRMVTTEDIAHLVRVLIDPASFLTGQIITIDGGTSLLWPDAAARRVLKP